MPENGFVMRFFGCARRSVGVVGAERSIQLSYGRTSMKTVIPDGIQLFGCSRQIVVRLLRKRKWKTREPA